MICTTIRKDKECVFMATGGCSFNGGSCKPIIESCEGCKRIIENEVGKYCNAYPEPSARWKNGSCNLATHVTIVSTKKVQKINPIKASKRAH